MKKHIFGLAIFSLIVGATAIVYAALGSASCSMSAPVNEPVFVEVPQYSSKTSCWKMKKDAAQTDGVFVKVNQAVINLQSKEFSWELAVSGSDAPIALHFFSKDGGNARYINTETISGKLAQNGLLRFNNTYQWISRRKSFGNLYVIAEFDSRAAIFGSSYQPTFDAARAVPVTVDLGELDYPIVGSVQVR